MSVPEARATTVRRTFTQADMDAFGQASGGTGHIHTDPDYAAGTPFGRTLVQGLFLLAVVERALSEAVAGWSDLEVKFVAPVRAGDDFRVEVVADEDVPGRWRVEGFVGPEPVLVGTAFSASRCAAGPAGTVSHR